MPAYWLSYITQDHQPRGDTTHSELGPPPSVPNLNSAPQSNLVGTFFQLRLPFPKCQGDIKPTSTVGQGRKQRWLGYVWWWRCVRVCGWQWVGVSELY